MQIEVTELEPCKLKIAYQADPEQIVNKRTEIVNYFKKAPVPGFRPGKATPDAIRFHYRDQIEESLKRALAEDAYHDTIFEKKLKPHGQPQFSSLFLGDGKFSCEFQLHTKPDFELQNIKNLEIVKPHQEEDANEIAQKMLQELRMRFGNVVPYQDNDFVQLNDSVIVDYVGSIDGQTVNELTAEGEIVNVGRSDTPYFDENLLGMTVGQTREFDLVAPSNSLPAFANKTIHFKVTLNMGSRVEPMPLDDSLATKLGKKDFEELKGYVLGNAQAKVAHSTKSLLNEAVSNKLVSMHDIDVPNWLTLAEAQYLAYQSKSNWNTMPDENKEKLMSLATKNVKMSLILDKIRDSEPEAQMSDQEAFDYIKSYISQTQPSLSLEDTLKDMNKTGYLQILASKLKDEHTLDFIVKNARIID